MIESKVSRRMAAGVLLGVNFYIVLDQAMIAAETGELPSRDLLQVTSLAGGTSASATLQFGLRVVNTVTDIEIEAPGPEGQWVELPITKR